MTRRLEMVARNAPPRSDVVSEKPKCDAAGTRGSGRARTVRGRETGGKNCVHRARRRAAWTPRSRRREDAPRVEDRTGGFRSSRIVRNVLEAWGHVSELKRVELAFRRDLGHRDLVRREPSAVFEVCAHGLHRREVTPRQEAQHLLQQVVVEFQQQTPLFVLLAFVCERVLAPSDGASRSVGGGLREELLRRAVGRASGRGVHETRHGRARAYEMQTRAETSRLLTRKQLFGAVAEYTVWLRARKGRELFGKFTQNSHS